MRLKEVDKSLQSLNRTFISVKSHVKNSSEFAELVENEITKIHNSTKLNNQVSSQCHGYAVRIVVIGVEECE